MPSGGFQVETISDPTSLMRLRPEWDDLYERADNPRLSQSFEWAWCAWDRVAQPLDSRLSCIAVRCSSRLVLIWPLIVMRHKRFWTVATSLASPEDYTVDMLVDGAAQADQLIDQAWNTLWSHSDFDFVHLERLRTDSALYRALHVKDGRTVAAQRSPFVTWDRYRDWDSYWRSTGNNFRKNVDRVHRRLSELGSVSFEVAETSERRRELLEWMFKHKEEWLTRKRLGYSSSIGSERYMSFLFTACEQVTKFGNVVGFALLLDGMPLSTQISLVRPRMIENIHIAYDFNYARFSPGLILDKYVLQWAYERRVPYDFHFGTDDRKRVLANDSCDVVTVNYYKTGRAWAYECARSGWNIPLIRQLRSWMANVADEKR